MALHYHLTTRQDCHCYFFPFPLTLFFVYLFYFLPFLTLFAKSFWFRSSRLYIWLGTHVLKTRSKPLSKKLSWISRDYTCLLLLIVVLCIQFLLVFNPTQKNTSNCEILKHMTPRAFTPPCFHIFSFVCYLPYILPFLCKPHQHPAAFIASFY